MIIRANDIDATQVGPKIYLGKYPGDGMPMIVATTLAGFDRVVRVAGELPHEFDVGPDCSPMAKGQAERFELAAEDVANGLRLAQRTLVCCAAGINRSALVAGLAMHMAYGVPGQRAYVAIRSRRRNATHVALCNPAFAAYLCSKR